MTEHLQLFGQGIEIALLLGIFYRTGGLTARMDMSEHRLNKIEEVLT